jgi:hypothetical protein
VQEGGHIRDIVDTSIQLIGLAKIVDTNKQGFPASSTSRVLELVTRWRTMAELLKVLRRPGWQIRRIGAWSYRVMVSVWDTGGTCEVVLRMMVAYLHPDCSRSSSGDVPAGEMAYGAGHRGVAETVRVHKEAVVRECDHKALLQGKLPAGDPNRMDAGDVVGSRAAAAVAAGDRAEAGGAGIATIGEEVVDNSMEEEVPAEEVQEVGNTW